MNTDGSENMNIYVEWMSELAVTGLKLEDHFKLATILNGLSDENNGHASW